MTIQTDFLTEFGSSFTTDEQSSVGNFKYKHYYNFDYGIDDKKDIAILNCIAHLIVVKRQKDQPVAPELSVSIGAISKTYQSPETTDFKRFFNSTQYGQQFLAIIMFNAGGVFV